MALFEFSSLLSTVRAVFRRAGNGVYIIQQVFYEGLQLVDQVNETVATKRSVVDCPGFYLDDHFGPFVDVQRNAMGDDQYRLAIMIRMLALRTAGTTNQLLYLTRYIMGPEPDIKFEAFYPKAWVITVLGGDPKKFELAAPLMDGLATAGENGVMLAVDPIVWAPNSVHGPVTQAGMGWFSSVYGPVDSPAGMAHAIKL